MKKLILLCVGILAGVSATAQDISQSRETNQTYIYFSDALNLAHTQNLTLQAGKHEHAALKLEKKAMGGLRSPQFGLTAGYTLMSSPIGFDLNGLKQPLADILNKFPAIPQLKPFIDQLMGAKWNINLQEDNMFVFGATMVAPIYMGGKINAANNAAKIRIKESENKTEKDKSALCSELAERYFGLSLSLQVVKVREDVTAGMQKHYNDALLLEKNGIIAKGERLYAEMFLSKAKVEQQKSIRDVSSINTALENTMNTKGKYNPITNMFVLNSIEPADYFILYAMNNSPLLKQVDYKKDLAKEQVKAKRAEMLPTLSAMGAANIADWQLSNVVPRAVVGVTVNYKLFNGLKNINEYKASKETVKMVEIMKEKAELDIATLIEKSHNDILSLSEQIDSYDTTIEFAKEYLRVKTKAFNEGVASSSDVVDAQLNLAKSLIERLQLAYQYDVALAKMLEVCGLSNKYQFYMVGSNSKTISYQ